MRAGRGPALEEDSSRGTAGEDAAEPHSKIGYVDAHGSDEETSDVHLDHCPNGLIMNTEDAKTLVCWYRLSVVELAGV